jgi:hypothetical protein
VGLHFVRPNRPMEGVSVGSLSGNACTECLGVNCFGRLSALAGRSMLKSIQHSPSDSLLGCPSGTGRSASRQCSTHAPGAANPSLRGTCRDG